MVCSSAVDRGCGLEHTSEDGIVIFKSVTLAKASLRRVMASPKEFLGRGWAFPFHFNPASGKVAMSEFEENIRQNVSVVLGTRQGERQMLPSFGCRIHELLFAPNTSLTAHKAKLYVEEALERWEPRISVVDVRTKADPGGSIKVDVTYKIPSTGSVETIQHNVSN